jgi:hypothetical protein
MGAIAVGVVLLAVAAPRAAAESVSGEGWNIEVPEGFERAPQAVEALTAAAIDLMLRKADFPVGGDTDARVYVVEGASGLDAAFAVLRIEADGDVPSAADLSLDDLGMAPEGVQVHTERLVVGRPPLPAVGVTMGDASRTSRTVLVPRRGFLLAVTLQGAEDGTSRWQDAWDKALATLAIDAPAPGTGLPRWVIYAGIGGLASVLGCLYRARRSRATALPPVPSTSTFTATFTGGDRVSSAPSAGIRAIDGLGTFRGAEAAAPVPAPEPRHVAYAEPAPAESDPEPEPESAPVIEPRRALLRPPTPVAVAEPTPTSSEPVAKPRIVRNRDFLGS